MQAPSRNELLEELRRLRRLFRRCTGYLGQYPLRRVEEALRLIDANPERALECYWIARQKEPYAHEALRR